MGHLLCRILGPAIAGLLHACAAAPPGSVPGEAVDESASGLPEGMTPFWQQSMPVDRQVRTGVLDNGFRYYVRHNRKPENRLELRLVVKAGSVLEEDAQRGLAHFLEHMAFNGTESFARQELVDYMKSLGIDFGPEVNAYTGFDETVYELQVPADSVEAVEKAFQILGEWAHRILLEGEAIDRERSVVIEEWRQGRGAGARLRDRQLSVLLRGSRYAERLPIGSPAVLDTFRHEDLRAFYRTWYRPGMMALIAVGDGDPVWLEEQARLWFEPIPAAAAPRERPFFPVPDHEETLFAVASDPEATQSTVSLYYKMDARDQRTVGAYRQYLVEGLYRQMLNQRLYELTMRADPPFLFAESAHRHLVRTKEAYTLSCVVSDGGILRGLAALLTEARRVQLHGFTQAELERQKKERLRFMEQVYRERDKTDSRLFAEEYVRHFLIDEPIPGIEYEYGLYQTFLPEIGLDEVNRLARAWNREVNRVVAVSLPEKEGSDLPGEEELRAVFARVAATEPEPYKDDLLVRALLEEKPEPVRIAATREFPEIGVTEWTLENGARAVLKPTDFRNDEILFSASSPGGHSLVPDAEYIAALTADEVIREGGVGAFDKISLDKLLAGRVVRVAPWIDELQEGFSGGASPEDVETLFQLIYLYATAPRRDSAAFASYYTWLRGMVENRSASPEAVFADTVKVVLAQHHLRKQPWSSVLLEEMDLDTSLRVYRERFGDAGDFTFFFAGNFTLDQMRPLVQRYLGNLPSTGRRETWQDIGVTPPSGVVEKRVYRGVEEKSLTQLIFTGPFAWTYRNLYLVNSLASLLRIRLREVLREELGGTYGVDVQAWVSHYPDEEYGLSIRFGCAPERADELNEILFAQLDSMAHSGPDPSHVQQVQENQRRQREVDLKENRFWLGALEMAYFHGLDPRFVLEYERLVDALDVETVQWTASQCFDRRKYIRVVLLPERYKNK